MAVKVTLIGLTLLFAFGGLMGATSADHWWQVVGAMIPAALLAYMTIRVFRDSEAKPPTP